MTTRLALILFALLIVAIIIDQRSGTEIGLQFARWGVSLIEYLKFWR